MERMSSMRKEVRGLTVSDISITVIHKSEASRCQRAAAVCLLTHSHRLNLYKSRGGFTPAAPTSGGGGPSAANCYSTSTFTNFHLSVCFLRSN